MEKCTPSLLAGKAIVELEKMADPARARQAQKYFKEKVLFYGITSVQARGLAQALYQEIRADWDIRQALAFCQELLQNPYHEARGIGILVLQKFKKRLPFDMPDRLYEWAGKNYLDNWALVDVTFPELMGAYLEQHPEKTGVLDRWAKSKNRWVRRASIVSLLKLTKKKEFQDGIYRMVSCHFQDQDDLIQKANGWLLREVGKSDMQRLAMFLRKNGPAIPRTTLRYAIERFEETLRKRILIESRHR